MGAENCADGCGRRGCKGVAGNGWGEVAIFVKVLVALGEEDASTPCYQ